MNTSIATETELSSVNSILGAIGQAPISRIYNKTSGKLTYVNPEISFIHQILMEVNSDVQNEGWVFNRENNSPFTPDAKGEIHVPANVLRLDMDNATYRPQILY